MVFRCSANLLRYEHVIHFQDTVVGRNLASSLLDYLIRNCHHNNRGVLKHNLQVIKTLTKVWKNLLEINYKFV